MTKNINDINVNHEENQKLSKAITKEVEIEIEKAIKKHGLQTDIAISDQMNIVTEEYLEIVTALNDKNLMEVRKETIQTIAMLYKLIVLVDDFKDKVKAGFFK